MPKDEQINSSVNSPLKIGDRVETDIVAIKHFLARGATEIMSSENLSKTKMAARMEISRRALDRLLDPTKTTITLKTLDHAARLFDKKLHLGLVEAV